MVFEEQIARLDVRLFDAIYSQLLPDDKRSLLAIHNTIRRLVPQYTYLEIGSYTGGSIQPHLIDPSCRRIYSIDKRPYVPPDDRGIIQKYPDNSTERMLKLLGALSPDGVKKVICFDDDAMDVDTSLIEEKPHFCFIDGEHTEKAVISDFRFCRSVMKNGIICFHDGNIVFTGLQRIVEELTAERSDFRAYALPMNVFVIELGGFTIYQEPDISPLLVNNHVPYLAGLMSMEHYREVYNSRSVRALRFMHRRLLDVRRPARILTYFRS